MVNLPTPLLSCVCLAIQLVQLVMKMLKTAQVVSWLMDIMCICIKTSAFRFVQMVDMKIRQQKNVNFAQTAVQLVLEALQVIVNHAKTTLVSLLMKPITKP